MIRHKGVLHPGQHPPIVDEALFDEVQHTLDANRRRHAQNKMARTAASPSAPLTGRIFDAAGQPMSPTASQGKLGKRYRYYVSTPLQKGSKGQGGFGVADNLIRRIPAQALERQLAALLARLVPGHRKDPLSLPLRIEVHAHSVHLVLPKSACPGIQARLTSDERIEDDVTDLKALRLIAAVRIGNRRGRTEIRSAAIRTSTKDPVLIGALQRAHAMIDLDARHLPVCRKSPATQYGRRLLALAFLAPDLQRAILDGTQPADLTLDHLMAKPLPADWGAQRQLFDHI